MTEKEWMLEVNHVATSFFHHFVFAKKLTFV